MQNKFSYISFASFSNIFCILPQFKKKKKIIPEHLLCTMYSTNFWKGCTNMTVLLSTETFIVKNIRIGQWKPTWRDVDAFMKYLSGRVDWTWYWMNRSVRIDKREDTIKEDLKVDISSQLLHGDIFQLFFLLYPFFYWML